MITTATLPGGGEPPPVEPPHVLQPPSYGQWPPENVPPPDRRGRWYRRGWVIAVGALLVGVGIGSAAGSSKTAPRAATVTAPAQTVVQTVPGPTKTGTVVHVRKVPGPTTTVTQTVQASTPTPATPSGGGGGRYSGNGEQQVGTINVAQDSTLNWTCNGECSIFSIANDPSDSNSINLTSYSGAHSGQTNVSAGTYTRVQVITGGTWTFSISPG